MRKREGKGKTPKPKKAGEKGKKSELQKREQVFSFSFSLFFLPLLPQIMRRNIQEKTAKMSPDHPWGHHVLKAHVTSSASPIVSFVKQHWQLCFLLGEFLLDLFFIWHGPYHPIDYDAYLDQVDLIMHGTRNYHHVKGRTGPLVYPGGHVAIFMLMHLITRRGTYRLLAQLIFMGVQLLTAFFVSEIYRMASVEPFIALVFWGTIRGRNVFVNGLFNDSFEILFVSLGIYLLLKKKMTLSLLSFSAAVSVKMSALLYAPGVALVFLSQIGLVRTMIAALPGVGLQILVGFPFLWANPMGYLSKSFEFSRTFGWTLSHNWKFLPEAVFNSSAFHALLMFLHIAVLITVATRKGWLKLKLSSPGDVVFVIFACNFIGIAFARSLHYSFYVWYLFTLPFLLVQHAGRIAFWHPLILLVIEISWNQWHGVHHADPLHSCASWKASLVLTCCHLFLLGYIGFWTPPKTSVLPTSATQKGW